MEIKFKPISYAEPKVYALADGTVLNMPAECFTRSGNLKTGVLKAILLKQYGRLKRQYNVKIQHKKKKGA